MKTQRNILIAFILNLAFSIFEFAGGLFTNSVAIMSDAVHDLGDALSIGMSYFLEKKSKKNPDASHTYGYKRYSVLGSLITTVILLTGSVFVIVNAVKRLINPVEINYNSMLIFAVIGVVVNLLGAFFTHKGDSLNQKAVNLHMLEDVLGWIVVLVGAVVMKFTDISVIDPLMSIAVAVFILVNTLKNLKKMLDLFLMKTPDSISVEEIEKSVMEIEGVCSVHHVHLISIDSFDIYATMHIVADGDFAEIKHKVKDRLKEMKVSHITLELESPDELCSERVCAVAKSCSHHHHHHH